MDNMAADGELNSRVFPLADTSRRNYPIEDPVDCTWEMVVKNGKRVRINGNHVGQKITDKHTPLYSERQCMKANVRLHSLSFISSFRSATALCHRAVIWPVLR